MAHPCILVSSKPFATHISVSLPTESAVKHVFDACLELTAEEPNVWHAPLTVYENDEGVPAFPIVHIPKGALRTILEHLEAGMDRIWIVLDPQSERRMSLLLLAEVPSAAASFDVKMLRELVGPAGSAGTEWYQNQRQDRGESRHWYAQ